MRAAATTDRSPAFVLLAFLGAFAALGGEKERPQVTVHLKSGTKIEARLLAEDEKSVTIATEDGTLQLPRTVIERIEGPGAKSPDPAPPKTPVPLERPRPDGSSSPLKPGAWSDADEQKIEDILNRYFAAKDAATRRAAFAELEKTKLDRRFEDLEQMREAARKKGILHHLDVPWRKGAPRGWYNLAIPNEYTPTKAWPLVIGLHGMPSDADNLVGWYVNYLFPRGYICLFPTTIHYASFWPAPDEKQELLRLLRHVSRMYRIDYRRIYCSGASGGGLGTWHWLVTLPELFAGGISASAGGMIFDKRLERLKEVPLYVHHGTKDFVPVDSAKRSVELARRYGANIELYISEGTGHSPPKKDWERAFDWLIKLPPKAVSPRYLLESPEGSLPVGYPRLLPFTVAPEAEPLARIYGDYKNKAPIWQFPSQLPSDDLVAGLIAIARILDPACEPEPLRAGIKRIAEAVQKRLKPDAKTMDILYTLDEVFFQAEGFSRDGADPSAETPEGYAADRALKLHRGNVFALTGLYVAVAGELGLPVFPVVSPYHAFARYDDGKETANIETSEGGGHFGDPVYTVGYGLRGLSGAKGKGVAMLLAQQIAALGGMARRAGRMEKATAATKLALALDPSCYGALLLEAQGAREAKQPAEALKALDRLTQAWPDYAAPCLLQGELLAEAGSGKQAAEAYGKGISAKLKPYGAAAAYDAELHYRIAAIYAPMAREALDAHKPVGTTYMSKFNEAILNALKNNPYHPGARKLLGEMGGKVE